LGLGLELAIVLVGFALRIAGILDPETALSIVFLGVGLAGITIGLALVDGPSAARRVDRRTAWGLIGAPHGVIAIAVGLALIGRAVAQLDGQ
jgi:hypothetical protein